MTGDNVSRRPKADVTRMVSAYLSRRIIVSLAVSVFLAVLCPLGAHAEFSLMWSRSYAGAHNLNIDDGASAVAIDKGGNVVVTGTAEEDPTHQGMTTRKYDRDGNLLWHRAYTVPVGQGNGFNEVASGEGTAVDSQGNVFASGTRAAPGGNNYDWVVRKYDPDGNLLWHREYGNTSVWDKFVYLAVDNGDNLIAGGACDGWEFDWMIRKYNPEGDLLWSTRYESPSGNDDEAVHVHADAQGYVIAAGQDDGIRGSNPPPYDRWLVRKYDPDGYLMWSTTIMGLPPGGGGGPVSQRGSVAGVPTTDSGRKILVPGLWNDGTNSRWLLVKYDPAGTVIWSRTYKGAEAGYYECWAAVVDRYDNVFVAGSVPTATQGRDWMIRKYNGDGQYLESITYNSPGNADDDLFFGGGSVAIDSFGDLVAAGWETRADLGQARNWRIMKFKTLSFDMMTGAPAYVTEGQTFNVTLTVTNSGAGDILNVTPVLQFGSPLSGSASVLSGPVPAVVPLLGVGAAVNFTWTLRALTSGTVALDCGAGGFESASSSSGFHGSRAVLIVQGPADLNASVIVSPAVVCSPGRAVAAVTVRNTGQSAANGVTISTFSMSGTGGAAFSAGPYPSSPVSIPGGGAAVFTFTYTGVAAGSLKFTVTATGTDAVSGVSLSAFAAGDSSVAIAMPRLEASLVVEHPVAVAGGMFKVYLTVSSTGCGTASGVNATVGFSAGSSLVSFQGTEQGGPVSVPAGGSRTFIWTYRALGEGSVAFIADVTGVDQDTGAALSARTTAVMKVSKIASVGMVRDKLKSGRILVAPNNIKRGDEKVGVFMKGDPNGVVDVGFYSEIGWLAGTKYITLDVNGEGVLEISRAELTSMGLGSGLCWIRAAGGGVKDKSPLIISPKGQ